MSEFKDCNLGIYRHYKGGLYQLISYATQESDGELIAIYKSLSDGTWWTRPNEEFESKFILETNN